MIERLVFADLEKSLERSAAVALLGPRQVGKTTLAWKISQDIPSIYLDLEKTADRDKLYDAYQFLQSHQDKLVILDEIHRMPTVFETLRGLIDEGRRSGKSTGRFLLLGSASIDLMRQSETLAGRIEYLELTPLHAKEFASTNQNLNPLWLRGGFPLSLLAQDDRSSLIWRQNFIRTYLERDIPLLGPRIPAETLERLWIMLAHSQGTLLNTAQLATNLALSHPTVRSYLSLFVDLLLVRKLPPLFINTKKRVTKSPKIYVRDSGLVHALLRIESFDTLLSHPVVGATWEGVVIETLHAVAPYQAQLSFYRTSNGAEIDLLIELGPPHGCWAIEIKRGTVPTITKGFHSAIRDIQPSRSFIVYAGSDRYAKGNTEVISVLDMAQELLNLQS